MGEELNIDIIYFTIIYLAGGGDQIGGERVTLQKFCLRKRD